MIKQITLHNFRTHKDTCIQLDSGINVFWGRSDHGKTSILRAINLIVNNRPLGPGIITDGEDEASVEIVFSARGKEFTVGYNRGKNNKYTLEIDGVVKEFTAFKQEVPQEIAELINFSELNIQPQFDPYFLIFDSPGQIATKIREIGKLDVLDNAVHISNNKINSENRTIASLQEEIKDVKAIMDIEYKVNLEAFEKDVENAEALDYQLRLSQAKLEQLSSWFVQYKKVKDIKLHTSAQALVAQAEAACIKYTDLTKKYDELKTILINILNLKSIKLPKKIENTDDLTTKLTTAAAKEAALNDIIKNINSCDTKLQTLNQQLILAKEKEQQLLAELMICPYCDTELDDFHKDKLIERFNNENRNIR